MKAEAYGWSLENGTYQTKWYDGDQLPQGVLEVLNDGNTSTSDEADIDQATYDSIDVTMKMINTSTTSTCAETNFMK